MKLNVASKVYGKRIEGLREAIRQGLISAAARAVADIQGVVIPGTYVLERNGLRHAPPVDRGQYKAGFRSAATPDGARIYHVNPKIAAIMEYGVRAGSVKISRSMIRELTAWAHRKGLEPTKSKQDESTAWAIAKHMQKYGIAPRRVFERERERLKDHAKREVKRFVTKHLTETNQ